MHAVGKEEEVGAPCCTRQGRPQTETQGQGLQLRCQASQRHTQCKMQAQAPQAGTREGLAAHGRRICTKSGALEASGGEE